MLLQNTKYIHGVYIINSLQNNKFKVIQIYKFRYKIREKTHKRRKRLYLFIVLSPSIYVHFVKANNPKEVHPHGKMHLLEYWIQS